MCSCSESKSIRIECVFYQKKNKKKWKGRIHWEINVKKNVFIIDKTRTGAYLNVLSVTVCHISWVDTRVFVQRCMCVDEETERESEWEKKSISMSFRKYSSNDMSYDMIIVIIIVTLTKNMQIWNKMFFVRHKAQLSFFSFFFLNTYENVWNNKKQVFVLSIMNVCHIEKCWNILPYHTYVHTFTTHSFIHRRDMVLCLCDIASHIAFSFV